MNSQDSKIAVTTNQYGPPVSRNCRYATPKIWHRRYRHCGPEPLKRAVTACRNMLVISTIMEDECKCMECTVNVWPVVLCDRNMATLVHTISDLVKMINAAHITNVHTIESNNKLNQTPSSRS
ncbi:hypothetical protein BROUX41_002502 [Berkeleyomyces rouxiae]|uniref:uncharacterized protein n=1 Tax=Berkeleyomyces rouxiae TaxID=2035830 RepID=UPI003B7D7634